MNKITRCINQMKISTTSVSVAEDSPGGVQLRPENNLTKLPAMWTKLHLYSDWTAQNNGHSILFSQSTWLLSWRHSTGFLYAFLSILKFHHLFLNLFMFFVSHVKNTVNWASFLSQSPQTLERVAAVVLKVLFLNKYICWNICWNQSITWAVLLFCCLIQMSSLACL